MLRRTQQRPVQMKTNLSTKDVVSSVNDWLARYEDLLKCDTEPVINLMLEVEKLRSVLRDLHEACDCWNAVQEREKARKAITCDAEF